MKLHLPKRLFTALIAAISFIAPAALTLGSAAWGEDASHWDITQNHSGDTQTIGSGDTLYIGNGTNDAKGSGTSSTVFESGKLTVESGGKLFIHGFTGSDRDIDTTGKLKITSDVEVQGGGTLHLEDGSYYFSGNINITGGSENVSTIHSRWDKGFLFDNLTGDETASLKLTGESSNTTFTLQGAGAYAGHIEVNNGNRDTRLVINSAGALASTASIAITGSNTKLAINTEAITLSHLSAKAGNSLILAKNTELMGSVAAVDASTVTIRNASASDATFSGTIGSGITLEVASGAYQNFGAVTNNGQMVLNGTVNIATAITGNGTVEVGGLLTLADYNELYNLSYTYSNPDGGTNSGFRTGYTGYFSQGALTVGETGRLAIANSADASITDAGYATGTIQQGDGIYYVNEALTYNAATMAADAVTSILVSSTGTLNVAGSSVGKSLSNAGTVNYSMDGGSVNVNSLFQTNTGVVKVDMNASSAETLTGTASLSADLGAGTGTVRVENAASFTNAGYKINSQNLVLNNVENATISGSSDCRISTSLELIQSNLAITRGDAFDYSDTGNLTFKIGAESILDLGSYRQSIRDNHIIEMAGGTLKGAGAYYSETGHVYGIDFYNGGRFNTSADSRIETNVGAHLSGKNIQFDVNTGKTLVMTGSLVGLGTFSKTAGGTMEYSGAGFAQSMTITGGTFTYAVDEDRTMNGRLNGGTLKQSGTGVLTFNASTSEAGRGTVNVAAGGVAYNLGGSNTDEITLTGISGTTFTKKGAGTLQVNTSGYAGDIDVSSGTLKFDGLTDSTTNNSSRKITVQDGASLDLNGKARHYKVELNQGATLTNTGAAMSNEQRQLHTITLKGDATVSGTGDFYLINDGYTTTYLDLNQHKLTKTGTNTFYLKNTTVQSAGVIRVEEGTVQTLSSGAGTLDISKASVEIANGGSFVLAEKNQQIQNLTLEAGGTLTVNSGYTLTTMGDVTWSGGAISGNLCLNGTVSQTGGTVDLSNAVLSGTWLSQFDKAGDASLPTTSGLYEATYKLVDGSVSLTSGEQAAQSTITVGGQSYELDFQNGTFDVASNYYVASTDSVTISASSGADPIAQATYFHVDGTLNIAGVAGDAVTVEDILTYSGGSGKLVLQTNATLSNNVTTLFGGTLSIAEGGTLNFGYVKEGGSDMSSYSKVELDGGTLNYNNMDTTLNNFTVTENGGTMYVADYKNTYTSPILLAGTTDIRGAFNYNTEWKSYLKIEKLTGEGTLTISTETDNNHGDNGAHVIIDSMSGFTGSIVLDPEKDATNRVEVTAALAKGDTLKASQITLNNANKSSFTLTGSGLYDMVDSGADKKVSGLDQADWTGTVKLGSADAGAYDLRLLGNTGSTIQIAEGCTFKTYLNNTGADATHTTFYSAFQLDGNLEINNGWSTRTYIFAGKIAGNGNLVKSTNSFTSKYNFTKDLSGWHGVLENKAGTLTVTLQELASTVDAAITQSGGTLNLCVETTDAATFTKAVTVSGLELKQSATFTDVLTASSISVAAGKTLTLDNSTASAHATQNGSVLVSATGSGNITLSADAIVEQNASSHATGNLTIQGGATLAIATEGKNHDTIKEQNYDLSSFTSVTLNNATIKYVGSTTELQNVTVETGGASLLFKDMGAKVDDILGSIDNGSWYKLTGTTTLEGDLTISKFTSGNAWKYAVSIDKLTGGGALNVSNGSEHGYVRVNDVSEYTGAISVTKSGGPAAVALRNLSGELGISGITLANGAEIYMVVAENASAEYSGSLSGSGTLHVSGGALTISGSNISIGSTIRNSGELTLTGTLNVTNISGLTQVGEESTSYVGGSVEGNGYTTTTYQLVSGSGSISYGESFAVTLNGVTTGVHGTSKGENTLTIDKAGSTFYVMTGEETVSQNTLSFISAYHVAKGATLELADAIANHAGYSTTITGEGTLHINIGKNTQGAGSHGNVLKSASGFTGVVEIESTGTAGSGNTQLNEYILHDDASFRLISGNHWSDGTPKVIGRDIELAGETVDSFTFRHANGVKLTGKVTGTYLTAGQKYDSSVSNNMFLSGAGSKIQHVTMKCNGAAAGKLTVEADMAFGTLFANEVVLTNSATLDIGYTDDSGKVISGDSSINGSFTLNANTGLNLTAGTMKVNGAVTNSGAITVSGGSVDFANTLGMGAGSSLSVSGGSATVSGALNVTGENVSLSQSDTGVLNLNGSVSIAQNAGFTLNGAVGVGSTITNNGTLTFTDSITIIGELSNFDAYPEASSGTTSYVDDTGNVRTDGNGFEKVAGLSYWLTDKDSTGTVNYGTITHVSHGTDSYELHQVTEGKNLYFTVGSNVGNIFFVNEAGGAAVSAAEAARATGFELVAGGNLSLAAGAETNANATIRVAGASTIDLAAGSTLNTFSKEGEGAITLTGSGTYDLGSGIISLATGISLGSSWDGTVKLSDVVASGMNFETYGNVASKVALNGVSGWFDRSTNNNVHIILEEKGLTFTDYSTAQSYNFGKGISGSGNFVIDARDDTTKPVEATPTIQIGVYEDPSLTWSGKFQVNDIRTDSAANPENAFVQLFLNGNGSYFDNTAESAGVEMNDSAGTLKVFAGHSSVNSVDKNGVAQYTLNDGLTTINGFVKNNSTGRLELTALNNTVFNKEVDVTSMTVNSGKTATMNSTLKTGTLKLGDTATITKAEVETATSMENVKLSEEGIASADETKATKGSVADAKVTLAALAEGTSFSIEDVTLSNVNIEAANAGNRVNLSGLSASDVQLTKCEFHMLDKAQPQVGMGGSPINLVEGGPTGYQFSTSLLNGLTLGADASMVVDLGDLSGFTGMDSGKPIFSITLEGFRISGFNIGDFLSENPGIYFAADSWLGQLLVAQGASDYVKGDSLEAGTQATAGSGVSVSYNSTSVGTVIIISGLQVPEPASATLGLAALMMLCARRRRRA